MKDREIRELFLQSEKQITIKEEKKQETYKKMSEELEKRRIPIRQYNMVFCQLQYMDKSFFLIYAFFICLGIAFLFLLQQTGAGSKAIIAASMIMATVLGIVSVLLIDKVFFGNMAELGASCYFNTKQCVAAYMVITGSINLLIMLFTALYVGIYWKTGILRTGVYILTPFLISDIIAVGVLSTETGRRSPGVLFIACIFLSAGNIVISNVPEIFYVTSTGVWAIACVIMGILLMAQIRALFMKMEKGEVLCMN